MYVEVNGAKLFFDVAGSSLIPDGPAMRQRPTFIVLHGGPGGDHSLLRPYFDRFADVAQVVFLDQRGNGRSGGNPETMNLDQWADDVKDFSDALGIEKPIVLGVSFGGYVAINYAGRHPSHPSKLIFLSTAARFHAEAVFAEFGNRAGPEARAAAEAFFNDATMATLQNYLARCMGCYTRKSSDSNQEPRRTYSMNAALGGKCLTFNSGEMRRMDMRAGLSSVECPTLVVAGVEDPICPVIASEEIFASLPRDLGRLEIVANAGHGVRVDEPEKLEMLIRDFLLESNGPKPVCSGGMPTCWTP